MKRDSCRRRAVLLIALVLAVGACRPTRTDTPPAPGETPTAAPTTPTAGDAACPPPGSEVVFREKVCDVDCVIYRTPNRALFLCIPGTQNTSQLPAGTVDSVKCVDDQIVVELTTERGDKRRETFDKKGNLVKTEQLP